MPSLFMTWKNIHSKAQCFILKALPAGGRAGGYLSTVTCSITGLLPEVIVTR